MGWLPRRGATAVTAVSLVLLCGALISVQMRNRGGRWPIQLAPSPPEDSTGQDATAPPEVQERQKRLRQRLYLSPEEAAAEEAAREKAEKAGRPLPAAPTAFQYPPYEHVNICQGRRRNITVNEMVLQFPRAHFEFPRINAAFRNPRPQKDGVSIIVQVNMQDDFPRLWGDSTITVLWVQEPEAVMPNLYDYARSAASEANADVFLTFSKSLMELRPDRTFYIPVLAYEVEEKDWGLHLKHKTKMVTMIVSDKDWTTGHKLRHAVLKAVRARPHLAALVEFSGAAVTGKLFADKFPEHTQPFRYAITTENSQEDYYVSEKMVDHMLTGSVLIYWGSQIDKVVPGIDMRGVIVVQSLEEILSVLENVVSVQDYESRLPALRNNLAVLSAHFKRLDSRRVLPEAEDDLYFRVFNLFVGPQFTLFGC